MNSFVLGQYVPGKSYLYKMDPRLKLIATILLMTSIFFLETITEILVALGIILVILLSARLSIFKAIKGLKPLLILSIFVFIFQIFFNRTGDLIYSSEMYLSLASIIGAVVILALYILISRFTRFKGIMLILFLVALYFNFKYLDMFFLYKTFSINVYKDGLLTSIFVFLRLIVVVFLATILTLTTKPTDLTLGIEWMFRPLKVIKINSEEIALIITIALRYIPTILDEAYKIMDAQAARGADFRSGSIFKRLKQIVSLLVPMFVISFERSDELADAMIGRNFVPGKPKTKYHVLKWKTIDTFGLIFSLLSLGGSICLFILL